MEEREDAAVELAGLLGVDAQQLLREVGGPWDAIEEWRMIDDTHPDVPRDPHGGWLFVGRGGPSVAIRVEPSTRAVTVDQQRGAGRGSHRFVGGSESLTRFSFSLRWGSPRRSSLTSCTLRSTRRQLPKARL